MTTTTLSKTQGYTVLSLQSIGGSVAVLSSAVDVTTKLGPATMFVHFGRRATTANTGQIVFRIEASAKSSDDGFWFPLYEWTTAQAATACESEAVSGTVSSGTNVITVASTTNLTAGDIIYIDNGTIANSEWGRIKSISAGVSVTIEDNLVNAQTGATIYDRAEMFAIPLDVSGVGRIRLVVDTYTGPGTQNIAVEAFLVTADSASTAA